MNDPVTIAFNGNGVIEVTAYVDDLNTVEAIGETITLACVGFDVETLQRLIVSKVTGKPKQYLVRQQWQIVP